ncbi:hypothetical protein G7085_20130 [Tessaracoccus sp. HDW20]|uniref:hypothetical protein n=1 Tax=Tessaracoccus coleopterorum TaxID=2714950 RepID=UPI0018D2C185|nr:hypothetical protein [Tessaracoccus coleopterorum]NHB86059.1 hypothetical protein [Tessaracoccus coleopterorum]
MGSLATPLRLALYALVLVAVFLGPSASADGGSGRAGGSLAGPPVATHTAGAHEPGEADDDEH